MRFFPLYQKEKKKWKKKVDTTRQMSKLSLNNKREMEISTAQCNGGLKSLARRTLILHSKENKVGVKTRVDIQTYLWSDPPWKVTLPPRNQKSTPSSTISELRCVYPLKLRIGIRVSSGTR